MTVRTEQLANLPDTLVDRFAAGDGVILTGAGVSRQDVEERGGRLVQVGVPSGERLRQHLLKNLRRLPANQSLEGVTTVYAMVKGRGRLDELIRRIYGSPKIVAPRFYDLTAALPDSVRRFITTNYEAFLERALAYRNPVVVVRDMGLDRVEAERAVVLKPHGDAQDPSTCVVTSPDYDEWEDTTGHLPAQLTTLFLQSSIVTIGYGAQDANLRSLLSAVHRRIRLQGLRPRPIYVVVPHPRPEDFAAYNGDEYDLVLVNATGTEFLEWLLSRLDERGRRAEARKLAELVDPRGVPAAAAEVENLRPQAAPEQPAAADVPDSSWLPYGEALLRLATLLKSAGRQVEAIHTRAQAARALRLGGDFERSRQMHESVYREALLQRFDTELFDRVESTMFPRDRGVGRLPEPSRYAEFLAALADIYKGFPQDPPRLIQVLEGELASGLPADEVALRSTMLDRLRAEQAVNWYDFQAAATYFGSAAGPSPDPLERDELWVRHYLFQGLSRDHEEVQSAAAALSQLNVDPAVEVLRLRALAWLLLVQGDPEAALRAFEDAANRSLTELRVVAASSAYRDAEWVLLQYPTSVLSSLRPGQSAVRLEDAAERENTRVLVHKLVSRAERASVSSTPRRALLLAAAAQRLAYRDIDPAGVFRASPSIAEAWIAALEKADDAFSLWWAVHHSACGWHEIDEHRRERWVRQLRKALRAHASPELLRDIAGHLCNDLVSRPERTGALQILAALGELIPPQVVNDVICPCLGDAFSLGWSRTKRTDMAGAACDLLEAVYEQIETGPADMLQGEVASLVRSSTPDKLAKAYIALAQATSRTSGVARNSALAEEFIASHHQLSSSGAWPDRENAASLRTALAAFAPRTDPATRDRIQSLLAEEAERGAYEGLAVLAGEGIPPDEHRANSYLRSLTDTVTSLTHPANPNGIGGGWRAERPQLAEAAARVASEESVEAAVRATVALLQEDRQWSVLRATWVFFLGRLARERSGHLPQALEVLLPLARGQYSEPGDLARFTRNHPFSSIQMDIGSENDLQGAALVALAALLPWLEGSDRERVREAILAALRADRVHVRWWAAKSVGECLVSINWRHHRTQSPYAVVRLTDEEALMERRWLIDAALSVLHDASETVREAAHAALKLREGTL